MSQEEEFWRGGGETYLYPPPPLPPQGASMAEGSLDGPIGADFFTVTTTVSSCLPFRSVTASVAEWSRRPPRERQTWVRFPLAWWVESYLRLNNWHSSGHPVMCLAL